MMSVPFQFAYSGVPMALEHVRLTGSDWHGGIQRHGSTLSTLILPVYAHDCLGWGSRLPSWYDARFQGCKPGPRSNVGQLHPCRSSRDGNTIGLHMFPRCALGDYAGLGWADGTYRLRMRRGRVAAADALPVQSEPVRRQATGFDSLPRLDAGAMQGIGCAFGS